MSPRFHWFLPTAGDGRALVDGSHGTPRGDHVATGEGANVYRAPDIDLSLIHI